MQTNTNTILLEWEAPSRPDHDRSPRWYITGGSSCGLMALYGIVTGTWSMALVFAFIPALYYLIRNTSHRNHVIRLRELGVEFDGRLTPWGELKEFWILSGPAYHELHIAPVKKSRAELVIQTGDIDPYALCELLGQYMPQIVDRQEHLLDAIIRALKI